MLQVPSGASQLLGLLLLLEAYDRSVRLQGGVRSFQTRVDTCACPMGKRVKAAVWSGKSGALEPVRPVVQRGLGASPCGEVSGVAFASMGHVFKVKCWFVEF